MIDCPGVVYINEGKNDLDVVLKGCIRAEKIDDPSFYIEEMMTKIKKEDLQKLYAIGDFDDYEGFLKNIALKRGKLLKVLKK